MFHISFSCWYLTNWKSNNWPRRCLFPTFHTSPKCKFVPFEVSHILIIYNQVQALERLHVVCQECMNKIKTFYWMFFFFNQLTDQTPYSIHPFAFALSHSLLIFASSSQSDSAAIPTSLAFFGLSTSHHHYHFSSSSFHAYCVLCSSRWSKLLDFHRNSSNSHLSSDSKMKTMLWVLAMRSINHVGLRRLPAAVDCSTRRNCSRLETDNCMKWPCTGSRDDDDDPSTSSLWLNNLVDIHYKFQFPLSNTQLCTVRDVSPPATKHQLIVTTSLVLPRWKLLWKSEEGIMTFTKIPFRMLNIEKWKYIIQMRYHLVGEGTSSTAKCFSGLSTLSLSTCAGTFLCYISFVWWFSAVFWVPRKNSFLPFFSAVLVSLWHESTHSHTRIFFLINIYSAQNRLWSYFHATRRILKWKNFVWLVEKINGQWTDAAARK